MERKLLGMPEAAGEFPGEPIAVNSGAYMARRHLKIIPTSTKKEGGAQHKQRAHELKSDKYPRRPSPRAETRIPIFLGHTIRNVSGGYFRTDTHKMDN
jgi:hypothetical protein